MARQRAAIDRAIRVEDGLAESRDNGTPGRLAWFHDRMGQQICIDGLGSASLKHLGDRAFAGRDSAGEAHENHRAGKYHGGLFRQQWPIDFSPCPAV